MTVAESMVRQIDQLPFRLQRYYRRELSREERYRVYRRFERHVEAVDKIGDKPDPAFLREYLEDMRRGLG